MLFRKNRVDVSKKTPSPPSSQDLIRRPSAVPLMMILLFIVVAACSAPSSSQLSDLKITPTKIETPQLTETATPYVVATFWTAKLIGKLTIVEGCVRVIDKVDAVSLLLVWPPDFEATIEKDTVHVIGGKVTGNRKEVILHDGEMVLFGGGEISQPNEQLLSSEPNNCPGPFWVVGSTGEPYPGINETSP